MKKLVKGALLLALVGTTIVGCEKEEVTIQSFQDNDLKENKEYVLKSNFDYPIILDKGLTIEENLLEVLTSLKAGEVLYSTNVNGVRTNEIRLNLENDDFPDNPEDPNISAHCHVIQSGCLAYLVTIHNYNLEHCNYSSGGIYQESGNMMVLDGGCDNDNITYL